MGKISYNSGMINNDSDKTTGDPFLSREELKKDLKTKSVQGTLNRTFANGVSAFLMIGSTIALARLLTPKEFGLFAMAVVIADFARLFTEMGLGTATIQRENIDEDEVSMLFWINVGIGVVSMVVLACLSPLVAWFYGEIGLSHLCMALSIIFLFRGLTVQHRSLLERQMRFGSIGAIQILSTALGICCAIVLALQGVGAWALVWREIVSSISYAAGVWIFCRWTPRLPRRNTIVRSSLQFGAHMTGFSIIQYFTSALDRILIGRFCGATPLGLYTRAYQLAIMPMDYLQMTIMGVGLSPLSTLQHDSERYQRYFSRLLLVLTFVSMPIVVLVIVQSKNVVHLLLGKEWLDAAPLLRLLAAAVFVKPILGAFQLVMVSSGKTKRYLQWGVINGVCMIIAFAIGIQYGISGITYSYTSVTYILLVWSLWYCFKETPINYLIIIKTLFLPVVSSLGAGIVLISLMPLISNTDIFVNISISVIIIAVAYLAIWIMLPGGRQKLSEFWSYRAELFKKR
jgi:O-antigen/teichoic acid export membrane protein